MSDDALRPIIIKRKKVVGGGGHHGGAWKVAYADFVTAMMAFFMLMWLLNATTEKQRKGLADYFSPTIAVARVSGGGDGAFSGSSFQSEDSLAQNGTGGVSSDMSARGLTQLEDAQLAIESRSGDSVTRNRAKQHIATRLTDEGLVIEVFDLEGSPLFDPGTTTPMPVMQAVAEVLQEGFELTPNAIAVAAHSQAFSPLLIENPSWSLTTGRAQVTRELLEGAGLSPERTARLTGHGQNKPVSDDPMSVRNNRLEIILLRSDLQ
jgi:chemotaxis protein MotB